MTQPGIHIEGLPEGVVVIQYSSVRENDFYLSNFDIERSGFITPVGRWLIIKPAIGYGFVRTPQHGEWRAVPMRDLVL